MMDGRLGRGGRSRSAPSTPVPRQGSRKEVIHETKTFLLDFVKRKSKEDGTCGEWFPDLPTPNEEGEEKAISAMTKEEIDTEISLRIQRISDKVDNDPELVELTRRVVLDGCLSKSLLSSVFRGGVTLKRIGYLFNLTYKAYKLAQGVCVAVEIVDNVLQYVEEPLSQWIVEAGGWESILGTTTGRAATVLVGAAVAVTFLVWRLRNSSL